jgi:hypothetical protein
MNQLYFHLTAVVAAVLLLQGCKSNGARITSETRVQEQQAPRSEPIFYNGKTYQMDYSPRGDGTYDMAVSGMGPGQKKDAIAVATSSLSYFACPDGHRGKLAGDASYAGEKWRMQAQCG